MAKVPFNQDVDEGLAVSFNELVDERGYTKYRAVEAAVRAFVALPPDAQALLMANNCKPYEIMVKSLLSAEVDKHLDELGPIRSRFLALLKQAKAQDARKK
jgi:hypothetical protein